MNLFWEQQLWRAYHGSPSLPRSIDEAGEQPLREEPAAVLEMTEL